MNIYRVEWDEKWTGGMNWTGNDANVSASDAESAIKKAKRWALRQIFKDEQDGGKISKVVGFKLNEVRLLAKTSF